MFKLPDFTELKLAALDAIANGVVITDAAGTILWTNTAFTTLTGYSAEEAVGKNPRILKSGRVTREVYEQLWNTIMAGNVWVGQLVNRKKDGSLYTEEMSVTPIKTSNIVTHFIAIKHDISLRVNAQNQAKSLSQFLDNVFENIPNMIFVKDAVDLRFVRINKAGEQLLGIDRSDLINKSDYDFFPKDQADNFTKFDREVLSGKTPVDIPEETINTKNFGQRILHTKKVPILNESGEPIYLLGISEDITKTKEAAVKLQEKIDELQRTNELMVNRELKMISLKEELAKYVPNS